jgi:hypothetical protein
VSTGTKPPNAGKGRKKGVPNKATTAAREALAALLRENAGLFQEWLTSVAKGEKEPRMEDGKPVLDEHGKPIMKWLRAPDPGYAMRLALDVAEFHIPRLARTEITGELAVRGTLIIED